MKASFLYCRFKGEALGALAQNLMVSVVMFDYMFVDLFDNYSMQRSSLLNSKVLSNFILKGN